MFVEERRREILRLIKEHGQVSVSVLSGEFSVSAETIRGDLKKLENEKQLVRTHGGAMSPPASDSITFFSRIQSQIKEKRAIAAMAASLVRPHDRIFMDASSTSLFLARELVHHNTNLTIITDSVRIILELAPNSRLQVICTGGALRSSSFSLIGPTAIDCVDKFHADIFFCSCTGLSTEVGATESDEFEVEVKKAMAARAERRILMLDHTKFGKVGLSRFLGFEQIDTIVTDAWNEQMRKTYPQIHVPRG